MAIATLDEVVAAEAAHDGTPATGVALPPGAAGIMGWLSAIVKASTPTAWVDRSGSTSATISPLTWTAPFPANAARQFARITNTSAAVLYIWDKAGTPAQAGAIPLQPGQSYVWDAKVPNTSIQVMSAMASMTFEAAEG